MSVSPQLTDREMQIARLVSEGLTNRQVASQLRVSERTVGGGLRRIYARLGVRTRASLRAWLAARGADERAPDAPHLPLEVSSFVGREQDLYELRAAFDVHRLVTLVGPGGVGKTRLAVQLARLLHERRRLAIHLVELLTVSEGDLVVDAVLSRLGARAEAHQPRRELVADHLASSPALLVLDCCEHVVGATAALLAYLLQRCPDLLGLATSRETLQIGGERVWPVAPLELPPPGSQLSPDAVRKYSALALLMERASEAGCALSLRAEDVDTVAQVCRRLDGLPLALELAAARMRTLSPAALLTLLDDRNGLGALFSGRRSSEDRHRTLHATIAWSHQLLTPEERRLFARLSVFASSFELAAAQTVGATRDDDNAMVAALLTSLVDKSMVVAVPVRDGELRYRMLDTIRAFGHERLVQSGQHDLVRERYAQHYADVLAGPTMEWGSAAVSRMHEHMKDARSALAWSCANRPDLVTRFCDKLVGYWGRYGDLGEACEWMILILARLKDDDLHRAIALANAAWLEQRHGVFALAEEHAMACLKLQRSRGDRPGIADALMRLGDVARHRSDHELARRCAEEGLALASECGTEFAVAMQRVVLGSTLGRVGDHDAGRNQLEEALWYFASQDRLGGIASCQAWLGEIALRAGDLPTARAQLAASLRGYRQVPDAWMVGNLYDLHAWLAAMEGDPARALRLAGGASAIRRAVGAGQPPALAEPVADALAIARRRAAPSALEFWAQGAAAAAELLLMYALREGDWQAAGAARRHGAMGLTVREHGLLPLIARGLADKEIAARLGISVRTAEYHLDRIRKKLGFTSRAQIAAWAVEQGLTAMTTGGRR